MLVQEAGGRDATYPFDARISVLGVADQSEKVRNQCGLDAELLTHAVRVADLGRAPIDLHHAVPTHALR